METVERPFFRDYILNHEPFYISTKTSWVPLIVDFSCRLLLFVLFWLEQVSYSVFIKINLLFLPLGVLLICIINFWRVSKKYSTHLNVNLWLTEPSKKLYFSFYLLTIIISFFCTITFSQNYWGMHLTVVYSVWMWCFYMSYIFIASTFLGHTMKISGRVRYSPYGLWSSISLSEFEEIRNHNFRLKKEQGENDIDRREYNLALLETNTKNIASNIETITLESIFLGALAFSGFVTIVSSDSVQKELLTLKKTETYLFELLDASQRNNAWENLTNEVSLFGIIALLSLLSSVFFILALANRIILSKRIDKLNNLINLAIRFNDKCETVENLRLEGIKKLEPRIAFLGTTVDSLIKDGQIIYRSVDFLYKLTVFLRGIGVYIFYLLISTSGLFYSFNLAVSLLSLLAFLIIIRSVGNNFTERTVRLTQQLMAKKGK